MGGFSTSRGNGNMESKMADLTFKLPDGKEIKLPEGATGRSIAESIGKRLAQAALGIKLDGQVLDLDRPLPAGGDIAIITDRPAGVSKDDIDHLDPDGLELIRHSASHVMAEAVKVLFPEAKLVYGPAVENGFYYDIDLDKPLSADDFPAIEKEMARIIKANRPFTRLEFSREEALSRVAGDEYKTENIAQVPDGETISFYVTGDQPGGKAFEDLCRGPHIPNTGKIGGFKLMKLSGAYLHGDESKKQLQRLYGTAWPTRKALDIYLERLRLAEERDHRKLGRELDIFHISDDVGKGLILWLPNGMVIRQELQRLAEDVEFRAGYKRVSTPHITKSNLYNRSGHLAFYKDSMYPPMLLDEDEEYYLKPMNCPHHHMIYSARPRSYRDLPLRLAEYGDCYRYEKSGELAGLLRVRGMCMNDAHIYCTMDQVRQEFESTINLHKYYYGMFRVKDFWVRLSLHETDKAKYVSNTELWENSEAIVREVLKKTEVPFVERTGEAAFYGPKIDYQMRNVVGREETASTTQLDFAMPERFDMTYIAEDGSRKRPYIIHRAPLGTHERMIAFLLEHFGGALPTWLSPLQVRIVPVSNKFNDYAYALRDELHDALVRVDIDESSDSFNKKIRNAITMKTPNIFIVGGKEKDNASITWRRYCVKKQVTMPFADAKVSILTAYKDRIMDNFDDVSPMGWS